MHAGVYVVLRVLIGLSFIAGTTATLSVCSQSPLTSAAQTWSVSKSHSSRLCWWCSRAGSRQSSTSHCKRRGRLRNVRADALQGWQKYGCVRPRRTDHVSGLQLSNARWVEGTGVSLPACMQMLHVPAASCWHLHDQEGMPVNESKDNARL